MGGSIQKMTFNATMESYIYVKVAEVTADEYVLTAVFCSKMSAMADVKVKAMMEAPGTYDWSTQPPMENITMQFQMDMDYLVFQSTNFTLDRATMAIKQVESFNEISFNLDLEADNIYSSSMDGTNRVVTYEDYDVSIDMGVFLNLTLGFAPL